MPPPSMQQQQPRFAGAPNNMPGHYQTYPSHSQAHNAGLPPPAHGGNTSFMNANSMNNPFSVNGNPLSLSGGFGGAAALGMPGATGLASHAAQMGFAGASPQQHHNGMGERPSANKGRIREVWKSNLHEEFNTLRQLIDKYPYVAMDTEFPGPMARPLGSFNGKSDYHYQCVRCNVDLLKVIQLGITLFNADGESPPASLQGEMEMNGRRNGTRSLEQLPYTWQFNFKFSLDDDMYSETVVEVLKHAGTNFALQERDGIDPFEFGALLISSGLVCDEDVKWIGFGSAYDFAYITKLLRRLPLPDDEAEFYQDMRKFFPTVYDVKYLVKYVLKEQTLANHPPYDHSTNEILQKFAEKTSLDGLAESLKLKRQGPPSAPGPESILIGKVFFRIRDAMYNGEIEEMHNGQVWGFTIPENSIFNTPSGFGLVEAGQNTPLPNGYTNGAPSTPNTGNARLVHTPSNNSGPRGIQPMTPGGGGGVFGAFDLSRQ